MNTNDLLGDFVTKSFRLNDADYKIVFTPELLPSNGELDFTGEFLGILIRSDRGTIPFKISQEPDKEWDCEKFTLDMAPADFPYDFIIKDFQYNGNVFKAVITPELYAEGKDEGLDFTGCIDGIIMSANSGTIAFQLEPAGDHKWKCAIKEIQAGLIDELAMIIEEKKNYSSRELVA